MKYRSLLNLAFLLLILPSARAEIHPGRYDMEAIRDPSTLETRIIEDWKPLSKDPTLRQKLVEITICEWWSGQKVRLPVTFNAPADGGPCEQLIIGNAGLVLKPAFATGSMLRLLKEHRVGVVLIGMNTIDSMEPAPKLMSGMKEHMLAEKNARYTPAWIWGMSDMRAITAAIAEKEVFQPKHILVTGGSKRGVATAVAGIYDNRVTAILPYAAPVVDPPGGPYVEGMMPTEITQMNEQFIADLKAGRDVGAPVTAVEPLLSRDKIRADERITQESAHVAGWSEADMKAMCTGAWSVCRTTDHWPALRQRGLEVFYNQGTNDNVSPGLLDLGRRFPDLPVFVIPGAQHGGAKEAGFMKQISSVPELEENLYAFAMHHFFKVRRMVETPKVETKWDKTTHRLHVIATFLDGSVPQKNELWTSPNRHPDYTMAMEYDVWTPVSMTSTSSGSFEADIAVQDSAKTLDLVTVHSQTEAGSTLNVSSHAIRLQVP